MKSAASGPTGAARAPAPASAAQLRPTVRRAPRGYWRETWSRYRRDRLGLAALAAILLLAAVAAGAPSIAGTRPIVCRYQGTWYFPALYYWNPRWENQVFFRDGFRIVHYPRGLAADPGSIALWPLHYADPDRRVEDDERAGQPGDPYAGPPSARNPFGTDKLGRDVLARMVHGASTALLVGLVSMGLAGLIGIVAGALAGWFGGWVDFAISLIEVLLSIPSIVLILALVAVLERPTIWHVMVVIGCTRWEAIARYVRADFLRLKETEFVLAARALGVPAWRIMFRHMLPNALAPVVVALTFGIAGAILLESGLSFIGIGTSTATPSWGKILGDGFESMRMWAAIVFPGLGVFGAVLAYNLAGDAFQEASDPRLRGSGR